MKLKHLIGIVKDKASISKTVLISKPNTTILLITVLRATTHDPSIPPNQKHIDTLLAYGHNSSRNTAATCIEGLMDRLHKTHNAFVAFKCLITIHHILKKGSFILQDQLSRGSNYLNLSSFHDNSTTESLNMSFWIKWYARVLESVLLTSRSLGFFLSSSLTKKNDNRVSNLLDQDLLKELDILIRLIEEICKAPDIMNAEGRKLIHESISLVDEDKSSVQSEIMIRVNELKERVNTVSFVDSVELVSLLTRYESCREKLSTLFLQRLNSVGERLWVLVEELREKIGETKPRLEWKAEFSESPRFGDGILRRNESVGVASGKLNMVRRQLSQNADSDYKRRSFAMLKTVY
ncbi:hypothetical protein ACHQM5_023749 [Ranunculus cassubicifolius]